MLINTSAKLNLYFLQTSVQVSQLESFAQQQELEKQNKDDDTSSLNEAQISYQRSPLSKFLLVKGERKDEDDYSKAFDNIFEKLMDKPKVPTTQSPSYPLPPFILPPPLPPPMMFPLSAPTNFMPFFNQGDDRNQYFTDDAQPDFVSEEEAQSQMSYSGSKFNPMLQKGVTVYTTKPLLNPKKQKDRVKPKKPLDFVKIVELMPEAEPPGCTCDPFMMKSGWGMQKRCVKRCAAHQKQTRDEST